MSSTIIASFGQKVQHGRKDHKKIYAQNGKVVGYVESDVFRRTVAEKHYLQKPPALALENHILDQLKQTGCRMIVFVDKQDGTERKTTLEHFIEAGIPIQRGGWPKQVALPLKSFITETKGGGCQPFLF